MRKLLNRKIIEQDGKYATCRVAFRYYNEIVPAVSKPKQLDQHEETMIRKTSRKHIADAFSKGSKRPHLGRGLVIRTEFGTVTRQHRVSGGTPA
jgi:hypothetical protein